MTWTSRRSSTAWSR